MSDPAAPSGPAVSPAPAGPAAPADPAAPTTGRVLVDAEIALHTHVPGRIALSVALAASVGADTEELVHTGATPEVTMIDFEHGTRVHLIDLPEGELTLRYRADRTGPARPAHRVEPADAVRYIRPSRYCPSDRLAGLAFAEFGALPDALSKVRAIVAYVREKIGYFSGASRHTDDAADTLLSGQGVCRDFAHLCITFCRAVDVPARYAAVYAPGLSPMDFHAVFEAAVDGVWYVFDATSLAPRQSLVRIATGRDATDVAFLTTLGGEIEFRSSTVLATIEPTLPEDDGDQLVTLG